MSHSSHKWIKVWTTILTDPDLDNLSLTDLGRWCKLLLYTKMHGENGDLKIAEPARTFCNHMQVDSVKQFSDIAKMLPNIEVFCNGEKGVTHFVIKKWSKYQIDDSSERVQKHRNCNATREEKNKKRKEKIYNGDPLQNFVSQLKENPAYKDIDIDKELSKMDAWLLLPKNKNRKKTTRFILNWLNKIDVALPINQQADWRG